MQKFVIVARDFEMHKNGGRYFFLFICCIGMFCNRTHTWPQIMCYFITLENKRNIISNLSYKAEKESVWVWAVLCDKSQRSKVAFNWFDHLGKLIFETFSQFSIYFFFLQIACIKQIEYVRVQFVIMKETQWKLSPM